MAAATTTIPMGLILPEAYAFALSNHLTAETISKLSSTAHKPPLFVYGSLMLPSLLARIINSPLSPSELALQMTPAVLHGYSRHAVRYADYPAVVVDHASASTSTPTATTTLRAPSQVTGFLVFGLTPSQRKSIDRFESGLYNLTRAKVEIELLGDRGSSKTEVEAEVYVWGGDRDDLLEAEEKSWSFEAFLGSGMGRAWEE